MRWTAPYDLADSFYCAVFTVAEHGQNVDNRLIIAAMRDTALCEYPASY
ncbi:hypothetical protein G3A39_40385 [Paraburkholderia aspalathi]|nr:hypothetical protein [Paraburkholderia aspalathi]